MSAVPSHLEDLQRRLRDLHYLHCTTVNGGLIANPIQTAIRRAQHLQKNAVATETPLQSR